MCHDAYKVVVPLPESTMYSYFFSLSFRSLPFFSNSLSLMFSTMVTTRRSYQVKRLQNGHCLRSGTVVVCCATGERRALLQGTSKSIADAPRRAVRSGIWMRLKKAKFGQSNLQPAEESPCSIRHFLPLEIKSHQPRGQGCTAAFDLQGKRSTRDFLT